MGTVDGSNLGLQTETLTTELSDPPADPPESPQTELPEYLRTESGVLRDIIDLHIKGKEISIRGAVTGRPEHAEWAHIVQRVAGNLIDVLRRHNPELLEKLFETEDHTNHAGNRQIL